MIGARSFIFNSRSATCYFRNQLWKSSERVERISQLLLGRDMMKPALAAINAQLHIQLAINEERCPPNLHQLTAILACKR